MPFTITAATPEDRNLVVDSLRAVAGQRMRVAREAAGRVAVDRRAGLDVRPSAVKVTALLAEADTLEQLAAELAAAPEVAVIQTRPVVLDRDDALQAVTATAAAAGLAVTIDPDAETVTVHGDDGTSVEAQRAAALAGLEPAPDEDELGVALEDTIDTVELAGDTATVVEEALRAE